MGHEGNRTGRYVRKLLPQKRQRTVRRDTDGWSQLWHINQNDLAETMIHHLARGTGLRGLAAIKP